MTHLVSEVSHCTRIYGECWVAEEATTYLQFVRLCDIVFYHRSLRGEIKCHAFEIQID